MPSTQEDRLSVKHFPFLGREEAFKFILKKDKLVWGQESWFLSEELLAHALPNPAKRKLVDTANVVENKSDVEQLLQLKGCL